MRKRGIEQRGTIQILIFLTFKGAKRGYKI